MFNLLENEKSTSTCCSRLDLSRLFLSLAFIQRTDYYSNIYEIDFLPKFHSFHQLNRNACMGIKIRSPVLHKVTHAETKIDQLCSTSCYVASREKRGARGVSRGHSAEAWQYDTWTKSGGWTCAIRHSVVMSRGFNQTESARDSLLPLYVESPPLAGTLAPVTSAKSMPTDRHSFSSFRTVLPSDNAILSP